jgi:hypothetical protein
VATINVTVDGGRAFRANLASHRAAMDEGLRRGVDKGAREYGRVIRLNLRRLSHPPGTPTPSLPGQPPALVTGHLVRSVQHREARRIARLVWMAATGPTAVYSRIHEKGGWTGRNHATYLPPRPYVGPAVREATPRVREIIRREVAEAMRRIT